MHSTGSDHTSKFFNYRKASRSSYGYSALSTSVAGDEMKSRMGSIEQAVPEIRDRLMRIETKIGEAEKIMSTKADLAELKASITEGFNSQTKWFVATAAVLAGIAFAAARLIH